MGLFQALTQWRKDQRDKRLARMQDKGLCPECYGHGYTPLAYDEYVYFNPEDLSCTGCDGSGQYDDWAAFHQRMS